MGDGNLQRTLGFLEESRIYEAKIDNNNSLIKMVKTMAMTQRQVAIKSSLALDGGPVADVFTISGGYVMIYGMIMFLTEAVSANACNMAWGFDPTTGASDIPIGSNLDINGFALGDMIWAEGDATALVKADQATNSSRMCTVPILGPPGGIDVDLANSDPTTGIADFIVIWSPLSADAYIDVV